MALKHEGGRKENVFEPILRMIIYEMPSILGKPQNTNSNCRKAFRNHFIALKMANKKFTFGQQNKTKQCQPKGPKCFNRSGHRPR